MDFFSELGTLCFLGCHVVVRALYCWAYHFVCRSKEHFTPVELSASDSFTHLVPRDRGFLYDEDTDVVP